MYSQEETIEAIRSFYLELTKLTYVEESWLRVPPPEGWDDESMARAYEVLSDKTDTVKDLLKHLPYLRTEPIGQYKMFHDILIGPDTKALCYSFPPGTFNDQSGRGDRLYPLPEYCIYLTQGDREACRLVLDTLRGTITETEVFATGVPRITVSYERYESMPYEDKWRAFPSTPVREFFHRWTRMHTKLIWMVVPTPGPPDKPSRGNFHTRTRVSDEDLQLVDAEWDAQEWDPSVDDLPQHTAMYMKQAAAVYNTHIRHGWPADFDKTGCRAAVLALESEFAAERERQFAAAEDEQPTDEENSSIDEEL